MFKVFIQLFSLFWGMIQAGETYVWKKLIKLELFMLNFVKKMELFNIQTLLLHEENDNNLAMFTMSLEKNFQICIIPNMPQY